MAVKKKYSQKKPVVPSTLTLMLLCVGLLSLMAHTATFFFPVGTVNHAAHFQLPAPRAPRPLDASHTVNIPILMYHYIEHVKDPRDTIRQKLTIYPETLDAQLKTMTNAGYTFLYASEVGEILDGKMKMPAKPVVLTFDDGYEDFYTDALPILLKYKVKSTAYIISGFIGRPNYMTHEQLSLVARSNLVEIGAHTVHHIDLQHATAAQATEEITNSKKQLEEMLHIPIVSFAYPMGRFNSTSAQIVSQAGFTNGVSTMMGTAAGTSNRYLLYRLRPGSRTGQNLLTFLDKHDTSLASSTSLK